MIARAAHESGIIRRAELAPSAKRRYGRGDEARRQSRWRRFAHLTRDWLAPGSWAAVSQADRPGLWSLPRIVNRGQQREKPPMSWWVALDSDWSASVGSTTVPASDVDDLNLHAPARSSRRPHPATAGRSHAEIVCAQSQVKRHFSVKTFEHHSRVP